MLRRTPPLLGLLCSLLMGCLDESTRQDPLAAWRDAAPASPEIARQLPQASTEVASRVDAVGRHLLASNAPLGIEPIFATLGVEEWTLFHRGPNEIYISEGLARQCESDAELAAVLALELGQIIAEREAMLPESERFPSQTPPLQVPLTRPTVGGRYAPDQTDLIELARFEERQPRRASSIEKRTPPPNAPTLAAAYLQRAGYASNTIAKVQRYVEQSKTNRQYEQQLNPATPPTRW